MTSWLSSLQNDKQINSVNKKIMMRIKRNERKVLIDEYVITSIQRLVYNTINKIKYIR